MRKLFTHLVVSERIFVEDIDTLQLALGCRIDYEQKFELGKPQAKHSVGSIVLWGEYTKKQIECALPNKTIDDVEIIGLELAKQYHYGSHIS